jgi:uncharacterized protein YbbC (DUF1343 family)
MGRFTASGHPPITSISLSPFLNRVALRWSIKEFKIRWLVARITFLLLLLVASAFVTFAAEVPPKVLNGIDVLRMQRFSPLAGKRVGLITNHTGLAADGSSTIDLLFNSGVCRLVALFSPEHGIRGIQDSKVSSGVDEKTGLPVHSLYGETQHPTAEMLRDMDALVFDIQDIGARFYTYSTTLAYCMEAAAKTRIPLFVLDRPNPLGGLRVEGPMLDADKTSFIGYMPLPVRHGMTVGELAQYFNIENKIGADLRVIEMSGWRRSNYLDDTCQVWVNPSPNMRSLLAAIFYPGVCLMEATNVSVGRGTDRPFEVIGAPWIEPGRLARTLNDARLPGVKFVALYFTPTSSVHQGQKCGGVNLIMIDREKFNSVLTGLTLVAALQRMYPGDFQIDKVLRLLGNQRALDGLKAGRAPAAILREGNVEMKSFLARRRSALIYGAGTVSREGRE